MKKIKKISENFLNFPNFPKIRILVSFNEEKVLMDEKQIATLTPYKRQILSYQNFLSSQQIFFTNKNSNLFYFLKLKDKIE